MKLSVCIAFMCAAQYAGAQGVSSWGLTVSAGLNSSWVTMDGMQATEGFSLRTGLGVEYQLNKKVNFQTGIYYSSIRATCSRSVEWSPDLSDKVSFGFALPSIENPILLCYQFGSTAKWEFSIGIGGDMRYFYNSSVFSRRELELNPTASSSYSKRIDIDNTDKLAVLPTLQVSSDFKLTGNKKLRLLLGYARSTSSILPYGNSAPPEVVLDFGYVWPKSIIKTLSFSTQIIF